MQVRAMEEQRLKQLAYADQQAKQQQVHHKEN